MRTGSIVIPVFNVPPGEGCTERGTDGRDLVLRLERDDVEVLVARQLVEDVRGRRDRIGAEEHLQTRALGARDQPEPQRLVAENVAVRPGGMM